MMISSLLKNRNLANVVFNVANRSFARASPFAPRVKEVVQARTPDDVPGDNLPKKEFVTVKTKLGLIEKVKDENYGTITMKDGSVYIGELVQNRQHGHGVFTFASGSTYEGMWREGMKHGPGKLKMSYGAVLEGEFEYDILLPDAAKSTFDAPMEVGTWVSGSGEGLCEFQNDDGSVLKGEFKKGKLYSGSGVMKLANGIILEGTWVEGCMEGPGKILIPNLHCYEGDLRRGRMHGRGTMTKADGSVYEGDFVHDAQEGYGKRTTPAGWIYEGEFVNNRSHGQGKQTCPKGVAEGEFRYGNLFTGEGLIMTKSGIVFAGQWREAKLYGNAFLVGKNKPETLRGVDPIHYAGELKKKK